MRTNLKFILVILLFSGVGLLQAAPDDEPLAQMLKETFKKPYLSVGFVLQVVGDVQAERTLSGNNGFNISNMRVVLSGELDKQFGYFLQTNFVNSSALLDAKLYLRLTPNIRLDAGLFKAPFSKEFLTGAASIDMVNRSQVVSGLAPGRQIGMQIGVQNEQLRLNAGLFNGNGFANNSNDNNDMMVVGRAAITPELSQGKAEVGLNAAISNDRNVRVAGGTFRGKRTLLGGDLRLEQNNLLLAGEYIYAILDSSNVVEDGKPQGFHLTAGYMTAANQQFLVRWDQFDADRTGDASKLIIFGYNLWPTSLTELQVNYIINTDDSSIEHHQVLVNAQVAF